MKKKSRKKENRSRPEQSEENRALNRELGNFGLEPPKIYKNSAKDTFLDDVSDSEFSNLPSFSRERVSAPDEKRTQKHSKYSRQAVNKSRQSTRKKSKLKRKIIFYASLTFALVTIVVILSLTVLFKIHTVTIQGNEVYTQKEISAVLPIVKEENLFLVDKESASTKVKENLPYVYDVKIKRKLPSTIIVTVIETPQVYCVLNEDKTYTYLDDTFKVLEERGGAIPEGATVIKNIKLKSVIKGQKAEFTNKKLAKNITKLVEVIKKNDFSDITALYSNDINNNFMVYDERITIKLGNLDNLEKKLYTAFTAIQKLNESNPSSSGTMTATNVKQVYFTEK